MREISGAKTLLKQSFLIGGIFVIASLLLRSKGVTGSLAIGVVFSLFNFWLWIRIIGAWEAKKVSVAFLTVGFLMKIALLGGVLWFLITQTGIKPIPFLIGASVLLPPIVGKGLGVGHGRV